MRALLLALLLSSLPALAAPPGAPVCSVPRARDSHGERPFPQELQRALDEAIRAELARRPLAGLAVGVLHGGRRLACGYGLRDVSRRLPATPRTTWRMASITKSFTSVAVLQLVEQGLIDLDADIRTLVPAYPEKRWPVTVRQLLGHLGGVPHHDRAEVDGNVVPLDTEGALALFADKPLVAEPGTRFLYTTWGYNLLGAAIEQASGQSYGDYLREHLFEPAGMSHAALDERETRDEHHAVGYRLHKGRLLPSRFLDVSSRFAGGGTRASVEDLLGFARAMLEHRLVSAETAGRMQATMSTRSGRLTQYGMGFATYPQGGYYVVAHAGGQPETSALLVMVPAEGLAIALATNVEAQGLWLRRLASRLMEVLLRDGLVRREEYLVEPVDAVVYEGLYRLFSYGLAYHGWATRGPGALPEPGRVTEAFVRVGGLLERARISEDPRAALERIRTAQEPRSGSLLIRVGVHMARVLEEAKGPERLRSYPALGPLAFFTDYLAACEAKGCPEALRFSEALRADVGRFAADWERTQAPALLRLRLDEAENPEALWPELEALAGAALHPDHAEEMIRVAAVRRARPEERGRWLERAVALQPRSVEARLALAELQLELGQEAEAQRSFQEAFGSLEGARALSASALLMRAARVGSPRVARGVLRAAVSLHPRSSALWRALARREQALGDVGAARAARRQARRAEVLAPEPTTAHRFSGEESPVPDDAGLNREHGSEPGG